MGPDSIVHLPPFFNCDLRIDPILEPLHSEAFVSELSIEAFVRAVLPRFPWVDRSGVNPRVVQDFIMHVEYGPSDPIILHPDFLPHDYPAFTYTPENTRFFFSGGAVQLPGTDPGDPIVRTVQLSSDDERPGDGFPSFRVFDFLILDGETIIDGDEIWAAWSFEPGRSVVSGSLAVPEPTTATLLGLIGMAAGRRRTAARTH